MLQLSLNLNVNWQPTPQAIKPKDCWQTPSKILDLINRSFTCGKIYTDPCTAENNPTKAELFYTLKTNGLISPWQHNAFVNPPYSAPHLWIEEINLRIASGEINEAISLLPTSCLGSDRAGRPAKLAKALCLWRGRIYFINPQTGKAQKNTSFTSAFLYWGEFPRHFCRMFDPYGITASW